MAKRKTETRMRPWGLGEYLYINGIPVVYDKKKGEGLGKIKVHLPGGEVVALADIRDSAEIRMPYYWRDSEVFESEQPEAEAVGAW